MTEVSLQDLTPQALQHLAKLPSLTILEFDVHPGSPLSQAFPDFRSWLALFPNVQHLTVASSLLHEMATSLKKMKKSSPRLNIVSFQDPDALSPSDLAELLEAVTGAWNIAKVREFEICNVGPMQIDFDNIRALLHYSNLSTVEIPCAITISDAQLRDLAMA